MLTTTEDFVGEPPWRMDVFYRYIRRGPGILAAGRELSWKLGRQVSHDAAGTPQPAPMRVGPADPTARVLP